MQKISIHIAINIHFKYGTLLKITNFLKKFLTQILASNILSHVDDFASFRTKNSLHIGRKIIRKFPIYKQITLQIWFKSKIWLQTTNFSSYRTKKYEISLQIRDFASNRAKKYSLYRAKMRFNYKISLEIAYFHFKSHNKFESNRTANTIKLEILLNISLNSFHSIAHWKFAWNVRFQIGDIASDRTKCHLQIAQKHSLQFEIFVLDSRFLI